MEYHSFSDVGENSYMRTNSRNGIANMPWDLCLACIRCHPPQLYIAPLVRLDSLLTGKELTALHVGKARQDSVGLRINEEGL